MKIVKNFIGSLIDAEVAQTTNSDAVDLSGAVGYFIQADLDVNTPSAKASDSGREQDTLTFPSVAGSTGGDYIVISTTNGQTWAAALNKSGADPEPTGAIWVAIPAGRKVNVDISGGTDAASVAALVETALDGLTGFTALCVTDDTAADGTMLLTHVAAGAVDVPVPHNEDDSGAGSISTANDFVGAASDIDLTDNKITYTAHGFSIGLKGQFTTSGTLPTGISAATDYFVIVVDANTYKIATSLNNANAGTAVDITALGLGEQTFTPTSLAGGSIKLQHRLDSTMDWEDVASSSVNVTADATETWEKIDPQYGEVRVVLTMTAGQIDADVKAVVNVLT